MANNYVHAFFLFPNGLSDSTVTEVVKSGMDEGWENGYLGKRESAERELYRYSITELGSPEYGELSDALEEIEEVPSANIELQLDNVKFLLKKNWRSDLLGSLEHIAVTVDRVYFSSNNKDVDETEQNVQSYLEVFDHLASVPSVTAAYSFWGNPDYVSIPTREDLQSNQFKSLFCKDCWINVLPESLLEGTIRNDIRKEKYWKIREYDGGKIGIVTSDNPCRASPEWQNARRKTAKYFGLE